MKKRKQTKYWTKFILTKDNIVVMGVESYFELLPNEVIKMIIDYLSTKDFIRASDALEPIRKFNFVPMYWEQVTINHPLWVTVNYNREWVKHENLPEQLKRAKRLRSLNINYGDFNRISAVLDKLNSCKLREITIHHKFWEDQELYQLDLPRGLMKLAKFEWNFTGRPIDCDITAKGPAVTFTKQYLTIHGLKSAMLLFHRIGHEGWKMSQTESKFIYPMSPSLMRDALENWSRTWDYRSHRAKFHREFTCKRIILTKHVRNVPFHPVQYITDREDKTSLNPLELDFLTPRYYNKEKERWEKALINGQITFQRRQ